jgi:UDP-N-acetylmuramoyl-L-alanyl-D-glutamate--2,6-diaminopimelate ligase
MLCQKGDIVLIAGKGHEDYQEIKGVKHHFDDAEVVTEILTQLNGN